MVYRTGIQDWDSGLRLRTWTQDWDSGLGLRTGRGGQVSPARSHQTSCGVIVKQEVMRGDRCVGQWAELLTNIVFRVKTFSKLKKRRKKPDFSETFTSFYVFYFSIK